MATRTRYDELRPALHINVDVPTPSKMHFLDLSSLSANFPIKGVSPQRFRRYDDVHKMLSALKSEASPSLIFNDPLKKVIVLQETLEILVYEQIISDILIESSFFSRFLQLRDQALLVTVMLYDFQKHKFCQRPPNPNDALPENMRFIAESLWNHRVKLSATLARMRIAAGAQSIAQLLPPLKMDHHMSMSAVPVYARMCCLPTSEEWTLAMSELHSAGISFVQERPQLKSTPNSATFITKDLLAFSPDCRSILYNSSLRDGPLSVVCPQDFTSYMSLEKLGAKMNTLSDFENDVIITNCDNGTIPAHVSSLMKGKGKVIVLGATPANIRTIENNLAAISVKNVQLIPVPFPNVDPTDSMFSNAGLIICNVPSSLTSILNPIDFIMQEGDEYTAQLFTAQHINMPTLLREQKTCLNHALKFPQAKYVAYFTRSNMSVENSDLVEGVLSTLTAEAEEHPEIHQYEIDSTSGTDDKGYLCLLKQLPRVQPAASDVIAQAILRGVLSADGINEYSMLQQQGKKKKKPKRRIFSQHEGIPMTFAAQQKIVPKKHPASLDRSKPFIL